MAELFVQTQAVWPLKLCARLSSHERGILNQPNKKQKQQIVLKIRAYTKFKALSKPLRNAGTQ